MDEDLEFRIIKPHKSISGFVESFWLLHNRSTSAKEIVVLPDGRIELTISKSAAAPFHIVLSGIETQPQPATLSAKTITFAISFKLLAIDYIFQQAISSILNYAAHMPVNFWDFNENDLQDFDLFCRNATEKIQSLLPTEPDNRKLELFDVIYSSKGSVTVKELAEKVYWSSRQMNRYFNQQFGVSLKTYCSILRFRASLDHIAQGQLSPDLNFTDQSHFIKEIKKFSGVSPKELKRNQNDRFIQFSVIEPK